MERIILKVATFVSVDGSCNFSMITVIWLIRFVVALSQPLNLFYLRGDRVIALK